MENSNGIKTWQWVVTAAVIIVLVIIGFMVFSNKGAEAPVTTPDQQTAQATNGSTNGIIMADQFPGNVAYASSVQMANTGWVVIQKNSGGKPGDVIGSAVAPIGINPVTIKLTQPMIDGMMYYATLYADNGDKKFDTNTDKPLTDASGNIIMKTFKASASAGAEIKG